MPGDANVYEPETVVAVPVVSEATVFADTNATSALKSLFFIWNIFGKLLAVPVPIFEILPVKVSLWFVMPDVGAAVVPAAVRSGLFTSEQDAVVPPFAPTHVQV